DPIFSLRVRVRVPPHATRRLAFLTSAAPSRREALSLIARRSTPEACGRVFTRAASASDRRLRELGIDAARAGVFRRLASALLYSDPALRPAPEVRARGEGGAPLLWSKGISGDLPIVLVRVSDAAQAATIEELLRAQAYWRSRQVPADLVILNEARGKNASGLQGRLEALASQASGGKAPDKPQGSVFVLRDDRIEGRLRDGLLTVARVVLDGTTGDLKKQIANLRSPNDLRKSSFRYRQALALPGTGSRPRAVVRESEAFNGLGGFSEDGREYVTVLREGASTPMPWSHVVANPDFGFLATATGGGYCWAINSQQNQVTPWSNDAVCDPPSEILYLRDIDDGMTWSATASPIRVPGATYVARFGPGYVKYECTVHGIESRMLQHVPVAGGVKISRLRLRNRGDRTRRLSVTAYVQWTLGAAGTHAAPFVVTSFDAKTGALLARNRWREEFSARVAFAAFRENPMSYSGDRGEFLGPYGTPGDPAALRTDRPLSRRVGAGLDPCGALQTSVELEPGGETEIVFLLGDGEDEAQALQSVQAHRDDPGASFAEVRRQWNEVFGAVQVRTPDDSLDRLLNGWLPYQVLACRLWARTAFYQASGAYGFRDQLQDVMALCVARPDLAREHILRAASRQFPEGDVQHWWLPPHGKGIRSRVSDDRLWLPYVTAHYVETTGDRAVLDEVVPFIEGDALKPGQNDAFFEPSVSRQSASLFEHCARAIEASMRNGAHGLPLMGSGDWNDGMNRVGIEGKGESVWLGWFLYSILQDFAPVAEQRGEIARVQAWRTHAGRLRASLDRAWDGEWYRRAYYDDGTPLGTKSDIECRIDSLAQSWSVISGGGDPDRAARAMRAVDEHLVRGRDGLVALFTAPFDRTKHDPGYIKGYPPGLRENGGQYTHGSIWSLIAFALLGDGDKAYELFRVFDPQRHGADIEGVQRYKVEPYVVCADVYSIEPHVGRGGWTWYSGSAGWLYRAGLEYLLGFRLHGTELHVDPCIPKAWDGFEIEYRRNSTRYTISVENPGHVCRGVGCVELDGGAMPAAAGIPLPDDGRKHRIRIVLGKVT
ncbi:MAG TPA: glycosyl transferase family 36, partial [Rhodanobacteraceae bacterium]|nr:glycosyl transferase family 36 [Rhodanobacteraceae bacterium]